jgi:hypothetical protein
MEQLFSENGNRQHTIGIHKRRETHEVGLPISWLSAWRHFYNYGRGRQSLTENTGLLRKL